MFIVMIWLPNVTIWMCSSVGRALDSKSKSRRFKSGHVHNTTFILELLSSQTSIDQTKKPKKLSDHSLFLYGGPLSHLRSNTETETRTQVLGADLNLEGL